MDRCRKWFSCFDRAFDFLDHFWSLFWFSHPVKGLDFSVFVDFKSYNTYGVKKWGKFPFVNAVLVESVNMFCSILSVIPRCLRLRNN